MADLLQRGKCVCRVERSDCNHLNQGLQWGPVDNVSILMRNNMEHTVSLMTYSGHNVYPESNQACRPKFPFLGNTRGRGTYYTTQ